MGDDIIPLRRSYVQTMVERISELEAEIERLRAAGDALYELISVRLVIPADQHDDAVEQIRKWKEARRG